MTRRIIVVVLCVLALITVIAGWIIWDMANSVTFG
jgi:hypothetical protein